MNNLDEKLYDMAKQYGVIPTYSVKYANSFWNDYVLRKRLKNKIKRHCSLM